MSEAGSLKVLEKPRRKGVGGKEGKLKCYTETLYVL